MRYAHIEKGIFKERLNRFVARVEIHGKEHLIHVKNTGRCRELLIPGARVLMEYHPDAKAQGRKTEYSLAAVYKGKLLINMDYGQSRFDLAFTLGGKPAFMEVKGVTLEKEGVAMFPDAPTERGVKHLEELAGAVKDGFEAFVLFVIQMKGVRVFRPNEEMHKAFADALRKAEDAGVKVLAYDCDVREDGFVIDDAVACRLR